MENNSKRWRVSIARSKEELGIDRGRWRKGTRNCVLCGKRQQGREDVLCPGNAGIAELARMCTGVGLMEI